ncbi:MAG: universal stress protein [Clostridia bacterium]|jgi:nucleotide-binding universal stress UspA family protein|nr:universal stress protein [Clostridia bacterium]
MFQRILLATDGSPNSLRAAQKAKDLALLIPNASITVIHVLPLTPELTIELQKELESQEFTFEEALREKARPVFKRTLNSLGEAGLNVLTRLETGHPAERIAEAANSGDYDLVVIGSRGLGDWQEILLGSVSEKVCHSVHIPVLIIK